jgi:hypothetical protein
MPLDLAGILDLIITALNRFFVLSERDAQIIALWVVHTHVFLYEIFEHSPHLIVWSDEPGSGKSNLCRLIKRVAANVLSTDRITGLRLEKHLIRESDKRTDEFWIGFYRKYELKGLGLETLLVDEADRLTYSDVVIGLMNSAHHKDGSIMTGNGSMLPVFAPMALFRLRNPIFDPQQNTTVDRSILIEMRKKDPQNPAHERARFLDMNRHVKRLPVLRQQIAVVVERHVEKFRTWKPPRMKTTSCWATATLTTGLPS